MSRLLIKREHEHLTSGPWRPPGIEGVDWKLIWLNPRIACIVDVDEFEYLNRFNWRLKRSGHCFYACRKYIYRCRMIWLKMHRELMNTPEGYDCHHKNRHTLDNRKINLENLTPDEHASLHLAFLA
jgi:hypothetical protein